MARLDVILPIRPNPPRLREVLESIRRQQFRDWRLIVLLDRDDGQNRSVVDVSLPDREVEFIPCNYPHEGFPAMLNRAVRRATAEFVARIDDDDVSFEDRFTRQVSLLDSAPSIPMVTGFAAVVDSIGKEIRRITQPIAPMALAEELIRSNIVPHSSVMFRRVMVLELGGYDESMHGCEDYDLWLRLLQTGVPRTVGVEVVSLLQHEGQMSRRRLSPRVVARINGHRLRACRQLGLPFNRVALSSFRWSASVLIGPLSERTDR